MNLYINGNEHTLQILSDNSTYHLDLHCTTRVKRKIELTLLSLSLNGTQEDPRLHNPVTSDTILTSRILGVPGIPSAAGFF